MSPGPREYAIQLCPIGIGWNPSLREPLKLEGMVGFGGWSGICRLQGPMRDGG